MRFDFDIGVVVNGWDMVCFPVGDIEWNLVDRRCDGHSDAVEVYCQVCERNMMHVVFGGDMVKAVGDIFGYGGVELSSKVSGSIWCECEVMV